jgi:hypothetical protein
MARWGTTLIAAAVISAALSFTSYELRILFWIDLWGAGIGWLIRAALVGTGVVLLMAANRDHTPVQRADAGSPLIR